MQVRFNFMILCVLPVVGMAQEDSLFHDELLPLQRDRYARYEKYLCSPDVRFHTAVKPWIYSEVSEAIKGNADSVRNAYFTHPEKEGSLFYRKLRRDNLLHIDSGKFHLSIDPVFNLEYGSDFASDSTAFVNGRGALVRGAIGPKFSFHSSYIETQSKFVDYLHDYANSIRVVPGQGYVKPFYDGFDYNMATAWMAYTPSSHFSFVFGHGKNFIGDGYRSLFLSDYAFNYPHLRVSTTFWKLRYVNLFAQFLDVHNKVFYQAGYYHPRKYAAFHYLSYDITRRFNIGIFESVIWQATDTLGNRGFDINYLNPVIFLRPVEFSLGSTDNAMMGLSLKYKIARKTVLYSQILLDEFKLREVLGNNGWYANKQAFQLGFKWFDFVGFKGLDIQSELNFVRPYMYSHVDSSGRGNYSHYNEPLAHPLGANFQEVVSFARYRVKSWEIEVKWLQAFYGADTAGLNFGKDLFRSYIDHPNNYGNFVGQGLRTTLSYLDLRIGYVIHPRNNMILEVVYSNRKLSNAKTEHTNRFVSVGLKTRLFNKYYDF